MPVNYSLERRTLLIAYGAALILVDNIEQAFQRLDQLLKIIPFSFNLNQVNNLYPIDCHRHCY